MTHVNSPAIHSEKYINDTRFEWWDPDQLSSILSRLGLGSPSSMLDVGVGGGHWGSLLASLISVPLSICGLDREDKWVETSGALFARIASAHAYQAIKGDAHQLPFGDNHFDIVTCQTLLMHCHTPSRVVEEMVRVLKPGGALLLAEPLNQLNRALVVESLAAGPLPGKEALWRVWLSYHQARRDNGLGDNNIAAWLVTLLEAQGLENIRIFQNEKVNLIKPDNWEDNTADALSMFDEESAGLILQGGSDPQDLLQARAATAAIYRHFSDRALTLCSPIPLLLFCGRKIWNSEPVQQT